MALRLGPVSEGDRDAGGDLQSLRAGEGSASRACVGECAPERGKGGCWLVCEEGV